MWYRMTNGLWGTTKACLGLQLVLSGASVGYAFLDHEDCQVLTFPFNQIANYRYTKYWTSISTIGALYGDTYMRVCKERPQLHRNVVFVNPLVELHGASRLDMFWRLSDTWLRSRPTSFAVGGLFEMVVNGELADCVEIDFMREYGLEPYRGAAQLALELPNKFDLPSRVIIAQSRVPASPPDQQVEQQAEVVLISDAWFTKPLIEYPPFKACRRINGLLASAVLDALIYLDAKK